jgi:hypothetical protein
MSNGAARREQGAEECPKNGALESALWFLADMVNGRTQRRRHRV